MAEAPAAVAEEAAESGALSREDILAVDDMRIKRVDVPQWKGFVHVRRLTCIERDVLDNWQYDADKAAGIMGYRVRLAALSMCDETGLAIFPAETFEAAITMLTTKDGRAINTIANAALDLNGMTDKGKEDAEGNSEAAQSDSSTSA